MSHSGQCLAKQGNDEAKEPEINSPALVFSLVFFVQADGH